MFVDNRVLISLKLQDVKRDQEANPHVAYPVLGCASRSESFLHPRGSPLFQCIWQVKARHDHQIVGCNGIAGACWVAVLFPVT